MQMELEELLNKAKELFKQEVNRLTYDTWLSKLQPDTMDENTITLIVEYTTQRDAALRYFDLITNAFQFITNKNYTVKIRCLEEEKEMRQSSQDSQDQLIIDQQIEDYETEYSKSSLNKKYTFNTFVVGNNNRFAHAASLAVAENPAKSYNPLFLYGGVGLGKTHLMHAIGNRVLENDKNAKILYVTSEKFTNQLINAIKDNKNDIFRNKYRNIDILLIDDIQFIAGKERVQEEFFHTFNSLHENGKQIIISSDKPPRDIQFLEDRLKSRFEWGLLADISYPDYETRLAILRKKAQDENILVDDIVLSNIAAKIESNIRELEGVLNKIVAYASLTHSPITIEMAEKAINEINSKKEKVISADYIQEVVAKYFDINKKDLASNKRSNNITYPRQIAMYLCREVAQLSFPKIGEEFGNRDHSTVMHGYKKIEQEVKTNSNTKLIVESVKNIIINDK